jgi:hypothetical protein
MFVIIQSSGGSTGTWSHGFTVAGQVFTQQNSGTYGVESMVFSFVVPVGQTYKLNSGSTLVNWVEIY